MECSCDSVCTCFSMASAPYTDPSLTHLNVSTVLNSVSVKSMELCLWIPDNLRSKIAAQSESEEERRNRLLDWWLKTSPYVSWQWLSGWSCYWELESAVLTAKRYIQRVPGEHSVITLYYQGCLTVLKNLIQGPGGTISSQLVSWTKIFVTVHVGMPGIIVRTKNMLCYHYMPCHVDITDDQLHMWLHVYLPMRIS